jgi:hypothetical protein
MPCYGWHDGICLVYYLLDAASKKQPEKIGCFFEAA